MTRPVLGAICLALALSLLPAGPAAAADAGFRAPTERDKCPVCGMFVAKYPDWTAEVVFQDGSYAAFDGAKDLFAFLLDVKRYAPGRSSGDIAAVYVTDYYSLDRINAREAYFVHGSDVLGPMGRELIPFGREADAREFLKDHRGKGIVKYGGVTKDVLRSLE